MVGFQPRGKKIRHTWTLKFVINWLLHFFFYRNEKFLKIKFSLCFAKVQVWGSTKLANFPQILCLVSSKCKENQLM